MTLKAAFLFVAPGADPGAPPMLEAQVSVVGRQVGIRPHGGSERRMMVTLWSDCAVKSSWMSSTASLASSLRLRSCG